MCQIQHSAQVDKIATAQRVQSSHHGSRFSTNPWNIWNIWTIRVVIGSRSLAYDFVGNFSTALRDTLPCANLSRRREFNLWPSVQSSPASGDLSFHQGTSTLSSRRKITQKSAASGVVVFVVGVLSSDFRSASCRTMCDSVCRVENWSVNKQDFVYWLQKISAENRVRFRVAIDFDQMSVK